MTFSYVRIKEERLVADSFIRAKSPALSEIIRDITMKIRWMVQRFHITHSQLNLNGVDRHFPLRIYNCKEGVSFSVGLSDHFPGSGILNCRPGRDW